MLIPGQDALFAGARIVRISATGSGLLSASIKNADDRMGLFVLDVDLDLDTASVNMRLNAFLRPALAVPARSAITRYLPESKQLAGQTSSSSERAGASALL